ncbi:succinylglutamate desuccinylase/aspartoacylase family protein [Patescibacteria group bacterium]|nr:succinylglutamate desuccinylase/aspartoacylase family protein [Patescibacteria group bacterium]
MKILKDYIKVNKTNDNLFYLQRWRIISGQPGPKIVIIALQHGAEVSSFFLLEKLLCYFRQFPLLKGSLVILPAVNVLGLLKKQRQEPFTGLDINRQYPGNQDNRATKIAYVVAKECQSAELVIDLHNFTSRRSVFTGVMVKSNRLVEDKAKQVLRLFDPELIWYINSSQSSDKEQAGALTVWLGQQNKLAIALELPPPIVLTEGFLNSLLERFLVVFEFYGLLTVDLLKCVTVKRSISVYTSRLIRMKVNGWFWPTKEPLDKLKSADKIGDQVSLVDFKKKSLRGLPGVLLTIAYPGFIMAGKKVATIGKKIGYLK